MKRFVLFVLFFYSLILAAVNASAKNEPDNPDDGKGKIKGVVVEKSTETPMEFANINQCC